MRKVVICLFCFMLTFGVKAGEDPIKILDTFGDWTAYVYQGAEGKICYMSSSPEKSVGKYKKRDDVFLMVTHRPADKSFDVVSVVAGYTYKKGSKPTLTVDKKAAITLGSDENGAWPKDKATDKKLVDQMKAGSTAVLRGTSKRGTATTDTFSLKGFSKAYRAISEACGQ